MYGEIRFSKSAKITSKVHVFSIEVKHMKYGSDVLKTFVSMCINNNPDERTIELNKLKLTVLNNYNITEFYYENWTKYIKSRFDI